MSDDEDPYAFDLDDGDDAFGGYGDSDDASESYSPPPRRTTSSSSRTTAPAAAPGRLSAARASGFGAGLGLKAPAPAPRASLSTARSSGASDVRARVAIPLGGQVAAPPRLRREYSV